MARFNVLPPDVEPLVSTHIAEIIALITRLIDNGKAYVVEGDVNFEVATFAPYGKLSGQTLEELRAGERVEVDVRKRSPADFVLWKAAKPGEPSWESPWGLGRPGWHIECSAMAGEHLGEVFDIHGGGIDLVFPHHENEIAQSRCGHGTSAMANVWMHNGFLQVEGEKMSKSLGNFVTIRELLRAWPGDVVRLQMLTTHYRQPIDWTESRSDLARDELEEWGYALGSYFDLQSQAQPTAVIEALLDDLNTPNAVAVLRELYSKAKRGGLKEKSEFAVNCKFLGFRELGRPGLFERGVSAMNVGGDILKYHDAVKGLRAAIANNAPEAERLRLRGRIESDGLALNVDRHGHVQIIQGDEQLVRNQVNTLISARNAARKAKDFKEADRIRDELTAMGIQLKDAKNPTTGEIETTWEVKR
ncbi:MAG: cysteine--tRNA ligase [Rhodospirillales bacterium]|nr:cysteine--tRNA ligase [Rhodospirillales bacterium]